MNVAGGAYSTGHKSLLFASKVLAASGLEMLQSEELREKAWEEHDDRTRGKEYETPLPEGLTPPLDMWEK
jgi:aminobenzoyl-glutamate utilization protein B